MKKKLLPITFSILFIVSCGGGGGGGGDSGPTTPTTPSPTVSLSADPDSVLLENTSTLSWSSTNATSCSASWTSQTGSSGSEVVTISTAGNNSFSITCTGDGGSGSASVTVEGYRNTDGVVVDGYISGADVFIDENDNWTADATENSTTSDNDGKFTIKYANGNLVSIGGTDLDSQTLLDNLLITHKLTGHTNFKAVTPVTSIAAFMEDASLVNAALGIDSSIDVFTFDPVANKGDGGINDYLYEKGNQLTVLAFALQNITNNLNTTTETTQDFFKAITEEVEKEYTETNSKVNIETEAFVTKVFDNVITTKSVSIEETSKSNTVTALTGMLPIIQVKSSDDLTTSVIRFAISTLQTDIQDIANGSASAEILKSYTEDLLNYIAEDQNVDSGEIAPDISAIADNATTSEDTAVEINVLLNDSYVTSSPFSISATNGTNGSTSISNNLITYSPDSDYNGSDSFSYTITQGDKTSSADVTVTIEAVNDAPSIDIASTIQVDENQTAVTTVLVSDVDEDELTLTLGGTDADSFNLSDENVLTFKEAPDYETKTSYSINLSLTDGTETVTKDVTIAIIDINDAAPVFTSDATFSAAENQTAIGTVTATDPEGDSFSFSISGSELSITPAGVLSFTSAPDYETKATYTATITVVDKEDNSATQDITVNVTNVNDNSPVFTPNTTFSSEENQTAIGTVTATDADGDDVTFTVSGAELSITSEGVLTFVSAPDYETKTSYTAIVTASDGTNSTTQEITVNVTNVNDVAPEFTSEATFSADENQTAIGTVTATDEDGDAINYSISGSEININSSSGVLTFVSAPDYETKSIYTATVTASDGNDETTQNITVTINNVNDNSPVINSDATFIADENQTAIGTVTATDADGDTVTFSISGSEISIDSSTGALTFVSAPDYETKSTYTATVTASDGIASVTQNITVTVNNLNDNSPTINSSATFNADENQTNIGTVSATDADGDDVSFSVEGENLNIDSNSGVLNFINAPDYETQSTYTGTVSVSDGANTSTQNITINIIDIDENTNTPVITSSASFSADENQGAIGTVTATDADGDSLTFTISGSEISIGASTGVLSFISLPDYEAKSSYAATVTVTDGKLSTSQNISVSINNLNDNSPLISSSANFSADENQTAIGTVAASDADGDGIIFSISGSDISINSSSGVISFISPPDYETKSSYAAMVTASDGSLSSSQNITVAINNLNDNSPEITSNSTFSVEENKTDIGNVEASDADGDSISFSIDNDVQQKIEVSVEANDDGPGNVYAIRGIQNKPLTLKIGKTYKFEHSSGHPLRFSTTSDGINSGGSEFTDGVDTSQNGVTIITVSASTPADLYYYCRIHSGMGGEITTSSATFPELTISDAGALSINPVADFETLASYSALISASDGTNTTNQNIQVNVTDIEQEGPTFNSASSFAVDENSTAVGTVSADDPFGSSVSYSLSGTDTESLNIDSDSGVLEFKTAPDFETKTSYQIIVTATGSAASTDQNVTITINNLNDNSPSITSSATFSADENQTSIGTIVAEDADGDSLTYSLSSNDILIDPSSGLMVFSSSPDYETTTSFSGIVSVSDGVNTKTQVITVNINNLNDNDPVFTSSSTFSVNENEISVATITASDADGDEITFAVSGADLSITSSGVLTFVSAPDYENQSTYSATITASDSFNSAQQTINISIININEAPVFTSNITITADENQTSIATVAASDPEGDSISFSISGSEILVDSNSGVLTFVSAPDYETKSSYTATVTASDGSESNSQNITVNINNLNDNAPAFTSSSTFSVDENESDVGTATASDADGSDITFSVNSDNISINSSTGAIAFISAPDYETQTSYTETITAADGSFTTNQSITININNLNDNSPIISSSATFEAAENQTEIGSNGPDIIASDADGDAISFSITGSEIEIDSSTGALTFVSAPDYETKSSYAATVTASDGSNSVNQNITVNIINVNDNAPVITMPSTISFQEMHYENQNKGYTYVATITYSDADYTDDNQGSTCSVTGDYIELGDTCRLGINHEPNGVDYETQTQYTAQVTVTNTSAGLSDTKSITINITDRDEYACEFSSADTFNINENQTSIGTVAASDADGTASACEFKVDSDSEIAIDMGSGALTFTTAPDYESQTSHSAVVSARNVGSSSWGTTQNITINIADTDDTAPDIQPIENITVAEVCDDTGCASGFGQIFNVLNATTDVDTIDRNLTYSIVGGADENKFYVWNWPNQIGKVAWKDDLFFPDYEDNLDPFEVIIQVEDGGGNTDSQAYQVTVTDVNETPVITSPVPEGNSNYIPISIPENTTSVTTIVASSDAGETLTYSLTGCEADYFSISSTGVVEFKTAPDFENLGSTCNNNPKTFNFQAKVSDGTYEATSDLIQVTVTDVNDNAPSFTSSSTFTINENQTAIGTVTATDADGDSITFSISGSEINIDASTGALTFASEPDYETKSTYTATVTANDGTNSTTQNITVNLNKSPSFTSNATFTADENQTAIGTVTVTDADGDSITFSISGSEINIDASTGALTFASEPDYETKSTYTATVTANDGTNSTTQNITVSINNLNDNSPVLNKAYSGTNAYWWWIYEEQYQISCDIAFNSSTCGEISANDADGDTITYSISNVTNFHTGADINDMTINSSTGVITLSNADWESGLKDMRGTVTASDGVNSDSATFRIELKDANDITYYLYADDGPYLGCIAGNDCDSTNNESLCNENGVYGNPTSSSSIWNYNVGTYGYVHNEYSPWNSRTDIDDKKPDVYKKESGTLIYIDKFNAMGYFISTYNAFRNGNGSSVSSNHDAARSYACGFSYWN